MTKEILDDKRVLNQQKDELEDLRREFESKSSILRDKEAVLKEYDRMIDESEKAYNKVQCFILNISNLF